jgi:type IV pilus assembly protein PilC
MPVFSYTAINAKGSPVNGTVDQPDKAAAINAIVKLDLRPISLKELKASEVIKTTQSAKGSSVIKDRVKSDQLVMFTRQLSAMVGAGVPLIRALNALSTHISESPNLKKILVGVIHDVEIGSTLGDALAKYPNTFNDIYVNMVRAGEAAGILEDTLKRLALQQEKNTRMKKKIKSAMTYPMVLIFITIAAFFGLMLFVVPQIGKIIQDLGGPDAELPAVTQFMLAVSNIITLYWYIIFLVIGAGVYGFLLYTKTPTGKYQFHYILLKTPILRKIVTKVAVAHFSRTFAALIEAGVAVLEALDVTSRAVGNKVFEKALVDAAEKVKNGKTLSSVIEANPIFPPIVAQMLLVGEETGQTDKVIVKVAEFYEEEVDLAIESLSSIIEPIMIVIMGGMVGLIAASVMLPIAGLAQNIQ